MPAAVGVQRLADLIAYQRAVAFKVAVYRVVAAHPSAAADWRFRSQLFDAASSVESNIAEGWGRRIAGEMRQFLRYATGSLFEAERRLLDGVARGYYARGECEEALGEARRCLTATSRLARSLEPFVHRPRHPGNKRPTKPDQ
jgi:four helix bundle protein